MKIVGAEVFVTCHGRNFVTLKITTEDGITGLGDATLNGRELSVASYLKDHVCPQLIGRDAHRIEDIWQFFTKARTGVVGRSPCRRFPPWIWLSGTSKRKRRICRCTSCSAVLLVKGLWSTATPQAIPLMMYSKIMRVIKRWALKRFACSAACRA